ncbi:hypothetical protein BDV19DRAFT_386963 [Aspergillus venezuelensis]
MDEDIEITLQVLMTLFVVRVSQVPPRGFDTENTIEKRFLNHPTQSLRSEDYDEHDEVLDDLCVVLGLMGQSFFIKYARPVAGETLNFQLHLPKVYLQLVTKDGKEQMIEQATPRPLTQPMCLQIPKYENVENYRTCDIKVAQVLFGQRLFKVSIAGDFYFCKICTEHELSHKVKTLQSISGSADHAWTPRLKGTVRLTENICGIITTCIDVEYNLYEAPINDYPEETRRKWLGQIQGTLDLLHAKGVTWGDVKAENVLIDRHQNAWVIDLWMRLDRRMG